MKKAFFAVVTVLLALVMFSCDSWPEKPPVDEYYWDGVDTSGVLSGVEYDANGNKLLVYTFGSEQRSKSRALKTDIAEENSSLYEVVFYDGASTYYRATWLEGQTGRLTIPAGTYATAENAVMFAGDKKTKTLLGTGIIDTPSGGVIKENTKSIIFILTPLEGNLEDGLSSPPPAEDLAGDPIKIDIIYSDSPTPHVVPLYSATPGTSQTFTYTFDVIPNPLGIVAGTPKIFSKSIVTAYPEKETLGFVVSAVSPAFDPTSGELTFDFTVPTGKEGFSWVAFEIPVVALEEEDASVEWFIRGGILNYYYLFEVDTYLQGAGGGILLGTPEATGIATINITGSY